MHDKLLSRIRQLHGRMHQNDMPPQNEGEHQAEFVINSVREAILGLVMQGVTPKTLEISLFYHWLRLTVLRRRMTDEQFSVFAADMGAVMRPLVRRLQQIESTLPNIGPTKEMREMGVMI